MTVREYVISQIQEVADAWAERVHSNPNRTAEDEDDLLRVAGMNMAVNIICGIDLMELEKDVEKCNACFECTFYDMWEGICVNEASDRCGESVVGLGACEEFEEEKEENNG